MATGDLEGNIERLKVELKRTKFSGDLDEAGVRLGEVSALLPVLQHTFLNFSRHVNQDLVFHGYELRGKSKANFVETAFKAIREHYSLKPVLTVAQFLDRGFAERKVMLLHDLICKCVTFHNEAVRVQRMANATSQASRKADVFQGSQTLSGTRAAEHLELRSTVIRQLVPTSPTGASDRGRADNPVSQAVICQEAPSSLHADIEACNEPGVSKSELLEASSQAAGTADWEDEQPADEHPFPARNYAATKLPQASRPPSGSLQHEEDSYHHIPAPQHLMQQVHQAGDNSAPQQRQTLTHERRHRHAAPPKLTAQLNTQNAPPAKGQDAAAQKLAQLLQGLLQSLQGGQNGAQVLTQLASTLTAAEGSGPGQAKLKEDAGSVEGQLTAMQRRQSALESELDAVRCAADQTKQQLQARIIVLETRLRAWEGAAQRPQYNPWTNAYGHGPGHQPPAAPVAGQISSNPASLRLSQPALPTFGGANRASSWPPLGADSGKENSRTEGREPARGFKVLAAGKWAGYEDTERLIQQIQGRYEEAQQILQRHS